MLRGLVFLVPVDSQSIFSFLNCDGHGPWSHFRKALSEEPAALASLAALADDLLAEHFASLDLANFVAVLAEPGLTRARRRPEDCLYGIVTALYIRGKGLFAQGLVEDAVRDWELALQFLGKELGLDFLESTSWPRSSEILLALAEAKSEIFSWPKMPVLERAPGEGPRAVDPLGCCQISLDAQALPSDREVVVYGYHPALIEPISALWPLEAVRLHWYGVSDRDCSFFRCKSKMLQRPIPARLRYKSYMREADVSEVEMAYRDLWDAEMKAGLRADLMLCMELRDAYFLWKVAKIATIYYPAIIFMQDEGMSEYGAKVLRDQFEELYSQDVLRGGRVAIVAQSPYLAASIEYHTARKVVNVRPLARYVEVKYSANSSTILVLCARTRLMMSHSCRGLFREGQHLVEGLRVRLPPGDQDVVHGFSFEEVARFRATVLIPWNIAVTTFHELYAMNMPLFVPDAIWLARLWPKQITSYGRSHPNLHQQMRPNHQHPTPYPSLDFLSRDFQTMLYWAQRYGFMEMPGVQTFTSIPELLIALKAEDYDLEEMSRRMAQETSRATKEVTSFWSSLMQKLL